MQDVVGLPSIAFAALGLIALTRARHALAVPASRLSWLASVTGAIALFAHGTVIPLPVLDGWLGGSNLVHLVQSVFATIAFWLVLLAVARQGGPPSNRLRWWPMVVGVTIFSLAFFCIDRGATATDFIVARSDQVALLVYAGVYLAGVASTCVGLIAKMRGERSWPYGVLTAGAAMVAAGSIAEIVFLAAQCFSWWSEGTRVILGHVFHPLFYPGVVLIASSIAAFSLRRAWRTRRLRASIRALETLLREHGAPVPLRVPTRRWRADGEMLSAHLYELVIVVYDHAHLGDVVLEGPGGEVVAAAERTISTRLARAARESGLVAG